MTDKKLEIDGYSAFRKENGTLVGGFKQELEKYSQAYKDWCVDCDYELKPVKIVDAERWAELVEWIEKARISFSEIQYVLVVTGKETTAKAIKVVMDDLNRIMPEETK